MTEPIDVTTQLAIWADALRAIAQTGLAFDPQAYDQERYRALLELAAEMAATVNGQATLDPSLAADLAAGWRADVRAGVPGYVTPKVGVGAIVFREDALLLIQRPDTGEWLYPTGWLDVGLTPAETAVKEVAEETGLQVEAERLVGIYDSHRHAYPMHFHMISVLVYCRLVGGELSPNPLETLEVGFFPWERLPRPLAREGHWAADIFDFHHRRRGPILE